MSVKKLAKADLARSGIRLKDAAFAGIGIAPKASDLHPSYADAPALVIPYFDAWTGDPVRYNGGSPFARIRYLQDAPVRAGNPFKPAKPQRYAQPPNSGVHAYFPPAPGLDWSAVAADPSIPLLIVEGEKKALASTLEGFHTIGLGGVHNFFNDGKFLAELERIVWKGRNVYICFDSDAAQNPQIQAAEARLATELSLHRGAVLHLVRLPHLASGDKQGVDDFLLHEGADKLEALLESAPRMRKIDAEVVALNAHVAWIEKEGAIYDLRTGEFIQKSNFVKGSVYSARKVLVPSAKGTGVKSLSVAEEWLTHPHAQRYDYALFRPEDNSPVLHTEQGGLALNMWTGFHAEIGDVAPFLELSEYLFRDMEGDAADLPLKLLAYKAQNPGEKIPLALVLIGKQGSGKSLWAACVADAFAPYAREIATDDIGAQFNGWAEQSLWAVINEADPEVMHRHDGALRRLISEKRLQLNEKFRPARQIDSYTQYIITSNERGAGAFSSDDRRMVVVSCPAKREKSFYDRIVAWRNGGGGKKLLHYLLSMDLQGWTPPQQAPLTSEKYMAYMESLSPIERLAEEMQTADEHIVVMWIQQALTWANTAAVSNNTAQARHAAEIIDSMKTIQIRPWYTPEELALMFPAITSQLHGIRGGSHPAGKISSDLRTAGIGYLRCADNPKGFRWRGVLRQFLVVAEPEEWTEPLTQAEFERLMAQFPRFGDGSRYKQRR